MPVCKYMSKQLSSMHDFKVATIQVHKYAGMQVYE